jgi:hypothetical protein
MRSSPTPGFRGRTNIVGFQKPRSYPDGFFLMGIRQEHCVWWKYSGSLAPTGYAWSTRRNGISRYDAGELLRHPILSQYPPTDK